MKIYSRIITLSLACVMLTALAGCVGSRAGQLNIAKEVAEKGSYYVEHQPKDGRKFDELIAERMSSRGYKAVSGSVRPADTTYVVTYTDRWMWDMRMYLFSLRIELHDGKSGSTVGFGESMQDSLRAMGKSFTDIVDTALDQLFKK